MIRRSWMVALFAVGAMVTTLGCQASMPDPASGQVLDQLEFDLTVNADRARFVEDGLKYQGSVGPYAVYQVTSANPRLIGPYIHITQNVGYAMLCGATHYFASERPSSSAVSRLRLLGGHSGLLTYVQTDQMAASEGDCVPPKDTFGNPIPDGGTVGDDGGTSDDGGAVTPPSFDSPDGGTVGGANPNGGSNTSSDPQIQRLNITFDQPPAVGSTVLLRRVALTGQRQHNGSHIIPQICCSHGQCSLGSVQ